MSGAARGRTPWARTTGCRRPVCRPCRCSSGQPEERRYRLRYRDNDLPVGEYSDLYVVTTGA